MRVAVIPSWRGTDEELNDLKLVAEKYCRQNENLACDGRCPHRMLGDQDTLNMLLFMRRIANRLETKEFSVSEQAVS